LYKVENQHDDDTEAINDRQNPHDSSVKGTRLKGFDEEYDDGKFWHGKGEDAGDEGYDGEVEDAAVLCLSERVYVLVAAESKGDGNEGEIE